MLLIWISSFSYSITHYIQECLRLVEERHIAVSEGKLYNEG